jgi:hypothetical protein
MRVIVEKPNQVKRKQRLQSYYDKWKKQGGK